MAKRQLDIIIEAKDNASKNIGKTDKALDGLKKAAMTAGVALAGTIGARAVFDLAKLGAQAERVEDRFAAFAREAGGAEAVLAAFSEGVGGAASKMEAMQSASKLLQMGLVGNTSEMEMVAEMASRLGDQTASVGDRVADFAAMLANQSIPRLDNFGISSGRVREKIEELQKTMGLTREEAFKLAVFEEGSKALGVLGERTEDSQMAFEKLDAKLEDLKVTLGKAIVPLIAKLVGGLVDAVDAITPWVEKLGEAIDLLEEVKKQGEDLVGVIEDQVEGFTDWVDIADEAARTINAVEEGTGGLNSGILLLGNVLLGTESRLDLLTAAQRASHDQILQNTDSYSHYVSAMLRLNDQITDNAAKMDIMTEAQWNARESGIEWINSLLEAARGMQDAQQGYVELENTEESYLEGLRGRIDRANAMREEEQRGPTADEVRELKQRLDEEAAAEEEAAARVEEAYNRRTDALAGYMKEFVDATEEQFKAAILSAIDPKEIGIEAWAALGQELGLLDQKAVNLALSVDPLVQAFTDGKIPAENMGAAIHTIYESADETIIPIEELLTQFGYFPEKLDTANTKLGGFNDNIDLAGNQLVPEAKKAIGEFRDEISKLPSPVGNAESAIRTMGDQIERVEGTHYVDIVYRCRTEGSPPSDAPQTYVPGPGGNAMIGTSTVFNQQQYRRAGDTFIINDRGAMEALLAEKRKIERRRAIGIYG